MEALFWNCTELGLSTSQVIIGSYPHGDGTFDKANDFQSVVVDGAWTMGLAIAKLHAGQVAYIVPAAKGEWLSLASCAPVTLADIIDWQIAFRPEILHARPSRQLPGRLRQG